MATINMHMKFEIEIPKQTWLMLRKPCRLQTDGRTDDRRMGWIQYTPLQLRWAEATRRPFWKWRHWKSIGFCLWPPSTCIWSLKLKFQSKLDLCSWNHVVYRQTDGQTDGRTDGVNPVYPPPTSLGGGIIKMPSYQYRKSHCGLRWSYDDLISSLVFPILLGYLYIESGRWGPFRESSFFHCNWNSMVNWF